MYIMLKNLKSKMKVLSRKELKSIGGNCGYMSPDGMTVWTGITKAEAMEEISENGGGHWCCASCGSATWYP